MAEIFVPGRLCLFGEHSDWAGEHHKRNDPYSDILPGKTLVVGTQEGIYATCQKIDKQILSFTATAPDGSCLGTQEFDLDLQKLLKEARKGGFWSYIAGTAYRIVLAHDVGGLTINNYRTTLPLSKGLSSSAAVCVLVARAFNVAFDLKLTTRGEMEFAYLGEVTTPSKCGRMDQACAYGSIPVLMTYEGDVLHIDQVSLKEPLHLVVVDLQATKDTTTILKSLQSVYPKAPGEKAARLRRLLGEVNHNITARALDAMSGGDLKGLGELMMEAQKEFDEAAAPMCPEQLNAPVLHKVLAFPGLQPFIYGGKGVGSQGDGTAQFLCKDATAQLQVCSILKTELGLTGMPLTVQSNF